MNDALQTKLLEWIISGLILILIGIVWWGARSYYIDMREREAAKDLAQAQRDRKLEERDEKLQSCISDLERSIWGLRDLFVLRKDYDRDMEALRGNRRTGDRCPADDCPFESTDAGPRFPARKV